MKSCNITDQFIEELSSSLAVNATLLHLNLSCNMISDNGCIALATCLRFNRTLSTLSLTGNSIGDRGATSLAQVLFDICFAVVISSYLICVQVLARFPLDHSEIVQRRKLLSLQSRMEEGHVSTNTGFCSSTLLLHSYSLLGIKINGIYSTVFLVQYHHLPCAQPQEPQGP